MRRILILFVLVINLFLSGNNYSQSKSSEMKWSFERTDSIGGFVPTPLNKFPRIIETSGSKAFLFNGVDEGILINSNPLGDASSFTIEVIFKPDSSLNPDNLEQRFLHVAKSKTEKPRILMEIRLLKNQKWALDTYIGSENSSSTLLDTVNAEKLHPAGQWYHVALVYDNGKVTNYINGVIEHSGSLTFHALPDAQISIGARQDPKSWFKGVIKTVRFTKCALNPDRFMK